jgi:hypothetical protein
MKNMTAKETYSALYIAKVKVTDILFKDVCARYGAPGTPAQWFIDHDCMLTLEGRVKLAHVADYLSNQLKNTFRLGNDYGWEREA